MAKKGGEFNEIYDLTAMRVIVQRDGEEGDARLLRRARDHPFDLEADARPVQGLRRDAEVQPLPVAAHDRDRARGPPLEIQVRTREMHRTAEFGIAAHWLYKHGQGRERDDEWLAGCSRSWTGRRTRPTRASSADVPPDLFDDEVYVFTPKGEVKTLPPGATPIDFAYAVHTDVGHQTVGAKVNGRIVPLHYRLQHGDFVEILTSKSGRGPSRDWLSLAASSRARNKIRQWFSRETRARPRRGAARRSSTRSRQQNLPYKKLAGSPLLAQVIREMGFKKAEDFYVALGSGKLQAGQIVNKVLQRLKTSEVAEEEPSR